MDLPHWAKWSWGESYLPSDVHCSSLALERDLATLQNVLITDAASAMPVVLGLGLLLRDFKRVLEYEEDEAGPDTPSYIQGSMMNLVFSIAVDAAIQEVFQQVTGLIDGAGKAHPTEWQEGDKLEQRPCEKNARVDENEEDIQMKVVEHGHGEKEAEMKDVEMQDGEDEDEVNEVNSGKEGQGISMELDEDEDNMEVDVQIGNEKEKGKLKAKVKGKGKQKQKQTEPRRSKRDRVPSKKVQMSR